MALQQQQQSSTTATAGSCNASSASWNAVAADALRRAVATQDEVEALLAQQDAQAAELSQLGASCADEVRACCVCVLGCVAGLCAAAATAWLRRRAGARDR